MLRLRTKELVPERWPDFEKLFVKSGGMQKGCWCVYYHRAHPLPGKGLTQDQRVAMNRRDKKALVEEERSHGILVYDGGQPVGWCQYGPREELPRIDSLRNYRKLTLPGGGGKLWRITCFYVDAGYRQRGVAKVALGAALEAIRRKGGGVVEAYPATHKRAVAVWFGSVAMFEGEGFEKVASLGKSNIVMRKTI